MKKIILSVIFLCLLFSGNLSTQALDLDLTITPIRNNFSVILNHSTTGSVTLYNNSTELHSFIMSAEDCTTNTNDGTPLCNPVNSSTISTNSLASWIKFDTSGVFSIAPKGKRVIIYTINTPANAIPGGHYGAIFFNIPTAQQNANISMNRRIGSLLLVTVPGNIVVSPEFGNMIISGAGGLPQGPIDSIGDLFSPSQTGTFIEQVTEKGKKLLLMFADPIIQDQIIDFINPMWDTPKLDTNDTFKTDFTLPIENKGTIHIVPQGQITLHEADGTQLRNIGKELITNEFGVFLREDIVDYLTINEGKSSVLPNTDRTFTMRWNGFAHESRGIDRATIIEYETPTAYYSRLAREEQGYIKPWEKLAISHTSKKINAKVGLSYIHPVTKEPIIKNTEIPLTIEYNAITKQWNTGMMLVFVYIAIIIWIIKRRKKGNKKHGNNLSVPYINDEIEALEIARNTITSKSKKTAVKKITKNIPEKTIDTKKTPKSTLKTPKQEIQTSLEKSIPVTKKTPVKTQPVKKVVTKKITVTETAVTKKSPLATRKAPVKKPAINTEI